MYNLSLLELLAGVLVGQGVEPAKVLKSLNAVVKIQSDARIESFKIKENYRRDSIEDHLKLEIETAVQNQDQATKTVEEIRTVKAEIKGRVYDADGDYGQMAEYKKRKNV